MDKSVYIIIPCKGESLNLKTIQQALPHSFHKIFVVPEGDPMNNSTPESNSEIILEKAPNYGSALRTGIAKALELSNSNDLIVTMDGDLSHDPSFINELICSLENNNADLVIASRFFYSYNFKTFRLALSSLFSILVKKILDLKQNDITSGFRAYRKSFLAKLSPQSEDFDIVLELLFLANESSGKIIEIPFSPQKRLYGTSKFRPFKFLLSYYKTVQRLRSKLKH